MTHSNLVLVAGATGYLGSEICRQLVQSDKKVRALVRAHSDPQKVSALKDLGVEVVTGDLKDISSLEAAVQDVGFVISTVSSTFSRAEGDSIDTVDRQGQLNLVEAARKADVFQFVYVSFVASSETFPLQDAKREVENRLKASGMNYTILRPTMFTEVWLSPALGFDYPSARATIYGEGRAPVSWISINDVASFAVGAVDNAEAFNAIIDLGGPEALTPLEAVSIFEETGGKTFNLQFVPEADLRVQKDNATDPMQKSFASLMLMYARSEAIPMEETLKKIPVQLHSVREYAKNVAPKEESVGAPA